MLNGATMTTLGVLLVTLGPAFSASAATLDGVVKTSAGQPVNGAMVTVFSANRMRKQTVFTNAEGRYLIVVDYEGDLTVRARVELRRPNAEDISPRYCLSDCRPDGHIV